MRKVIALAAVALLVGSALADNPPGTPMPNAPGYPALPGSGGYYGPAYQPYAGARLPYYGGGGYGGVYGSGCSGGQGGYAAGGCTGGQGYMTTTTTVSYGEEAAGCSGGQGGGRRGLFGRFRHRVRGGCN